MPFYDFSASYADAEKTGVVSARAVRIRAAQRAAAKAARAADGAEAEAEADVEEASGSEDGDWEDLSEGASDAEDSEEEIDFERCFCRFVYGVFADLFAAAMLHWHPTATSSFCRQGPEPATGRWHATTSRSLARATRTRPRWSTRYCLSTASAAGSRRK